MDHVGTHYMGFTMEWNYKEGFVDMLMPEYILQLLKRLNHTKPLKPQYSPHEHNAIQYNKKDKQ